MEGPRETPQERPQKGPREGPQEGPQEKPQKGPWETPRERPREGPQKGPRERPREGPRGTNREPGHPPRERGTSFSSSSVPCSPPHPLPSGAPVCVRTHPYDSILDSGACRVCVLCVRASPASCHVRLGQIRTTWGRNIQSLFPRCLQTLDGVSAATAQRVALTTSRFHSERTAAI